MKKSIVLIFCFLVVLSFSACSPKYTQGKKFNVEKTPEIHDGKTTKDEIVSMFGLPQSKSISGDSETWMYNYTEVRRQRTFKESFQAYLGNISAMPMKSQHLTIMFKGNIVKRHTLHVSGEQ